MGTMGVQVPRLETRIFENRLIVNKGLASSKRPSLEWSIIDMTQMQHFTRWNCFVLFISTLDNDDFFFLKWKPHFFLSSLCTLKLKLKLRSFVDQISYETCSSFRMTSMVTRHGKRATRFHDIYLLQNAQKISFFNKQIGRLPNSLLE